MLTKEEIKELFAETNKLVAENSKGIAELREKQEKTDAQIAETSSKEFCSFNPRGKSCFYSSFYFRESGISNPTLSSYKII